MHLPFANYAGLDIFLTVLDDLFHQGEGPLSKIILNGDIADFNGIKNHKKLPYEFSVKTRLKDEIFIVNKFLDHIQGRYPGVEVVFIEGNHEWRLPRYILDNAEALFDLDEITVESLFKLKKRKIPLIPYEPDQNYKLKDTELYIRHSPASYAKAGTGVALQNKHLSFLSGCTHREQKMVQLDGVRRKMVGIYNPAMADLTHPVFKFKGASSDNHVNGFALLWHDGPWWEHIPVNINNNRAIFGMNEYIGDPEFRFE